MKKSSKDGPMKSSRAKNAEHFYLQPHFLQLHFDTFKADVTFKTYANKYVDNLSIYGM